MAQVIGEVEVSPSDDQTYRILILENKLKVGDLVGIPQVVIASMIEEIRFQ